MNVLLGIGIAGLNVVGNRSVNFLGSCNFSSVYSMSGRSVSRR